MENIRTRSTGRTTTSRKVKERTLSKGYVILSMLAVLSTAIAINMFVYISKQRVLLNEKDGKIAQLTSRVDTLENTISNQSSLIEGYESTVTQSYGVIDNLRETLTAQQTTIKTLDGNIETLKADNKALAKDNKALLKEVDTLVDKVRVYEKYNYAVFDKAGRRTDLTYEQLKTGETLMKEKGYDPNLLFGILMVESNGHQNAKNTTSTATGYGQFLKATGKYIYEDVLKYGNYNHSINATNGDTAIVMMAALIDNLYKTYNGNVFKAMKHYSGRSVSSTYAYMNRINSFVGTVGDNVYDMNVNMK